jgi:hypothetical protein
LLCRIREHRVLAASPPHALPDHECWRNFMNSTWRLPNKYLSFPYYGSCVDEEQDAHEALEAAAASLLPGGDARKDRTTPRRRSGRIRGARMEGD